MDFALVVGGFAVLIGILLAIGKLYPGSGADVIDWKPTRTPEVEAELEVQDVQEMLDAQNERRRRSGRREIDEDNVRAELMAAKRERDEHVARWTREHGSGEHGG